MKILLSAFECQPNTGSEFGLGWSWASELAAMGHEIWVVTLSDNRPKIEQELQRQPRTNLYFVYCQMVSWLPWAYKVTNAIRSPIAAMGAAQLAKTWWQWNAYRLVKPLTQEVNFDLVHHVTNTSVRRPSFMGLLGIPFIIGPLAGGARTPWSLRKSYPAIGHLSDGIRDAINGWVKFDLLMHLTFARAAKIYCRSPYTQKIIPKRYRSKSEVVFDIGTDDITKTHRAVENSSTKPDIQVLFVGRFLYWKGVHLALQAFAKFQQQIPQARFTLIGRGRETAWLKKVAQRLGIEKAVNWIPWMERNKLSSVYLQHDVLLFPSLHDTGGKVVLEALSHGLPVVCLDLGGPGVMVDETCGRVIKTEGLGEETVVQMLSDSLVELSENPELREDLSQGASARPSQFLFRNTVTRIYQNIDWRRSTLS